MFAGGARQSVAGAETPGALGAKVASDPLMRRCGAMRCGLHCLQSAGIRWLPASLASSRASRPPRAPFPMPLPVRLSVSQLQDYPHFSSVCSCDLNLSSCSFTRFFLKILFSSDDADPNLCWSLTMLFSPCVAAAVLVRRRGHGAVAGQAVPRLGWAPGWASA